MNSINKATKVLVTGGAGFIGSHLVDRLMGMGYFVKVIDNLSSGYFKNIQHWINNRRFEFNNQDLTNLEVAKKAVQGVEIVFHLADPYSIQIMEDNSPNFLCEEMITTLNVLEAMRLNDTAQKIIFFSSAFVYGEPTILPTPETYGPLFPKSLYGVSKLSCESGINFFCHKYGLTGLIFRLSDVVGNRLIHGDIRASLQQPQRTSMDFKIVDNPRNRRSYLYVEDLLDAIFLLVPHANSQGECNIYNVSSGDSVNLQSFAELISDEQNLKDVLFRFTIDCDKRHNGQGTNYTSLSINKLVQLGWKPKFNSEEAIRFSCRALSGHTSFM